MKKTKIARPNPIFCKSFNSDPAISGTDSEEVIIHKQNLHKLPKYFKHPFCVPESPHFLR